MSGKAYTNTKVDLIQRSIGFLESLFDFRAQCDPERGGGPVGRFEVFFLNFWTLELLFKRSGGLLWESNVLLSADEE